MGCHGSKMKVRVDDKEIETNWEMGLEEDIYKTNMVYSNENSIKKSPNSEKSIILNDRNSLHNSPSISSISTTYKSSLNSSSSSNRDK